MYLDGGLTEYQKIAFFACYLRQTKQAFDGALTEA